MTSTAVGDIDVRQELVLKSETVGCRHAERSSAARSGLHLDIGLASWPGHVDGLTASRQEDFNNNDDDPVPHPDEFQTSSSEELGSPVALVFGGGDDVKFIDDDDVDLPLDGAGQTRLNGGHTTVIRDEDSAASSPSTRLGRRWGTVDLVPQFTDSTSPVPSPNAVPLKSIMKSPKPSSETTLSKTKKGISFSQDTVFK